jgi:hypothetical protein
MMHHFATFTDNGPCVAYHHGGLGYAVIVCECTSDQQAASEAARLNWEAQARAAMPRRNTSHYGMRRAVRHFENEDCDG